MLGLSLGTIFAFTLCVQQCFYLALYVVIVKDYSVDRLKLFVLKREVLGIGMVSSIF